MSHLSFGSLVGLEFRQGESPSSSMTVGHDSSRALMETRRCHPRHGATDREAAAECASPDSVFALMRGSTICITVRPGTELSRCRLP